MSHLNKLTEKTIIYIPFQMWKSWFKFAFNFNPLYVFFLNNVSLRSQDIFLMFCVMLMRLGWSVVTCLENTGAWASFVLSPDESWLACCSDIWKWRLLRLDDRPADWMCCANCVKNEIFMIEKLHGVRHCIFSSFLLLHNEYAYGWVCVSVCADVCGYVWA